MRKALASLACVAALAGAIYTSTGGAAGADNPTFDTLSAYMTADVTIDVFGFGLEPGAEYQTSWIAHFEDGGDYYVAGNPMTANKLGTVRFNVSSSDLNQDGVYSGLDSVSMWIRPANTDFWEPGTVDPDGNTRDGVLHLGCY